MLEVSQFQTPFFRTESVRSIPFQNATLVECLAVESHYVSLFHPLSLLKMEVS